LHGLGKHSTIDLQLSPFDPFEVVKEEEKEWKMRRRRKRRRKGREEK
jgi:hypothetical protein